MAADIVLSGRKTRLYRSVDVLICGGGLAGVAAASAAARAGADTLLVERNVVLGGNRPLAFRVDLPSASNGIAAELIARMREAGDATLSDSGTIICEPEGIKYACLDLVRESGAGLLLSTWASDPIMGDHAVGGAFVENKSGRCAIAAQVTVDATGDADLAVRAGAPVQKAAPAPLALNARIGGVDVDRALAGLGDWPHLIAKAKRLGRLAATQPGNIRLLGITENARARRTVILSMPVSDLPARQRLDIGAAETEARVLMRQFVAFLHTVPGFETCFLTDVAATLTSRPSTHIAAERVVTLGDAQDGSRHEDDISGLDALHFGIPHRALLPVGIDNLLVPGRAAGFAPELYERYGPLISSMALGEAAGKAAAAAVRRGRLAHTRS